MKVGLVIDNTTPSNRFLNILIGQTLDNIHFDMGGTISGGYDIGAYIRLNDDQLHDDDYVECTDKEYKLFLGETIRHCYKQGWFSEKKGEIVILDDEKAKPILGYLSL